MTFAVDASQIERFGLVTTFSPRGYEVYGRKFVETFDKYWPKSVRLMVYYEGQKPPEDASECAQWRALDSDVDRHKFMARYQDPVDPIWDYTKGIVKYSHKVWAMTNAPRHFERLFFLDGDTETIAPVTDEYLKNLCPDDYIVSYLGRKRRHSETGFLCFNTRHHGGAQFLRDFRLVYKKGDIAKLPALHDCAAFDFMREQYLEAGFRFYNLCPDAPDLEAFDYSPLKKCFVHNKGPGGKSKAYGTGEREFV